jgi:hypothetical protein
MKKWENISSNLFVLYFLFLSFCLDEYILNMILNKIGFIRLIYILKLKENFSCLHGALGRSYSLE